MNWETIRRLTPHQIPPEDDARLKQENFEAANPISRFPLTTLSL
jgi:hypothetical protein